MKRFVMYFLVFLIHLVSFSQKSDIQDQIVNKYKTYWSYNTNETAYLKTDSKVYFSGDIIHFNCLIFNNSFLPSSDISEQISISLLKDDGSFNRNYSLLNKEGATSGALEIPYDIPSGNYQLVASTRFMKNFDHESLIHRVPIYIQNLNEEANGKIAKKLRFDTYSSSPSSYTTRMQVDEMDDKLRLTIENNNDRLKGEYFLISEGLSEIQFISPVKAKKNKELLIAIPKDVLKGQFQKMILVDGDLKVIDSFVFFFETEAGISSQVEIPSKVQSLKKKEFEIKLTNPAVTVVEFTKNQKRDSISLFKRIYRRAFSIPINIDINQYQYKQLISPKVLSSFSSFTKQKWEYILGSSKNGEYLFDAKKNKSVQGVLSSKESLKFDEVLIKAHSFTDGISMEARPKADGQFSFDILFDNQEDYLFVSAFDKKGDQIIDDSLIKIEKEKLNYWNNVELYSQSESDSILNVIRKMKYILSTLEEDKKSFCSLFWSKKEFDETIIADEFQSLSNVEDYINETLVQVSVKKTNLGKKLLIFDSESKSNFPDVPFMLIDNKIVENAYQLLKIPSDSISEISVIHKGSTLRKFGSPFTGGVIAIKTKSGQFNCFDNVKNMRGINLYSIDEGFDFSKKKSNYFRKTILTHPITNEMKGYLEANYELGEYRMHVESLSLDGIYYNLNKSITVH